VRVRVYTLGEGEFYEAALRDAGLAPIGVGRAASRVLRLATFTRALRQFRPHVVQAAHFYVNLYVAVASRLSGALDIGAIRSDGVLDMRNAGHWGPFQLRAPSALVANSHRGRETAGRLGIDRDNVHVVLNVIETSGFDRVCRRRSVREAGQTVVILVGQLIRAKRVDRFLEALTLARRSTPRLRGVVVGDGPERGALEALASRLGLTHDALDFRGMSNDIPSAMAGADMLALTSDHEGFPNVLLEAMAARLPVVTTPAGDAPSVVEDGVTGFVVPFDAVGELADRLVRLAESPALRCELGEAGYRRVMPRYSSVGLAARLFNVYRAAAVQTGRIGLLDRLPRDAGTGETASRRLGATEV
jgi:glycosyltransferase involved in cell wall biosynthesis